jgi:hypothetical protein
VHGEAAFDVASSPAIAEHLARCTGHVHCLLLPLSYSLNNHDARIAVDRISQLMSMVIS